MASKSTGLMFARIAAVVIALGLGTWLVVRAQSSADPENGNTAPTEQPDASAPAAAEGGASADEEEPVPTFLPSSKSAIGLMPENGKKKPEKKKTEKKKPKPVFLPSSKSLPPMPPSEEEKEEKKAPPPKKAPKKIW